MRFSAAVAAVTFLGAATLVSAQYPACSMPCLQSASTGSCISSDINCLCSNQDFVRNTTQCMYEKCTGSDLQTALATAREVCAKVGVTLSSTPSMTGAASSASASSTASTSSASTTTTNCNALVGLAIAAIAASISLTL